MPKPLILWLQVAAQSWQMAGQAHKIASGGIWHRGEIGGWADCGRAWLGAGEIRMTVGKGCKYPNPWSYNGASDPQRLCHHGCFAGELALLQALYQSAHVYHHRERVEP